ncbi:MAG: hypothetical protein GWP06_12125 [Actinobacteria bacterium]|nr:hypothetical protein [Actinomycetota bacterium]
MSIKKSAGVLGIAGVTSIAQIAGCTSSTRSAKPNIIIMIADDAGWRDIGYHGSEIKTPCLDKFSKEGVELNHSFPRRSVGTSRTRRDGQVFWGIIRQALSFL